MKKLAFLWLIMEATPNPFFAAQTRPRGQNVLKMSINRQLGKGIIFSYLSINLILGSMRTPLNLAGHQSLYTQQRLGRRELLKMNFLPAPLAVTSSFTPFQR